MEEKNNDESMALWLLNDRVKLIQKTIEEEGAENFCISFSGGKDSTVLSWLIDYALPGNEIPRVYADTGIELNMIRDFVYKLAQEDNRIHIIKPSTPIKAMLERDGYPFKSKKHSCIHERYTRLGKCRGVLAYLGELPEKKWSNENVCPKVLQYQFNDEFKLKISDKCCTRLKEEPMRKWQRENKKKIPIIGVMQSEGGRRAGARCRVYECDRLKAFQPLAPVSKEWETWLIDKFSIEICDIYKPPYNFIRTGCKGCPFARCLQQELDTLEKYFPNERRQCETIWKPVYDEYRRLGYRLKPLEEIEGQMTLEDTLKVNGWN